MALIIRVICVKSKSNDLHEKIVSGFTCHPSKYPYLISVVKMQTIVCGGSLLNSKHVLTAGHCCRTTPASVYAGLSERKQYVQTAEVSDKLIHSRADLCILQLSTPLQETPYTKFTTLATEDLFNKIVRETRGKKCLALGFGIQSRLFENKTAENITYKKELQCVHQDLVDARLCGNDQILCAKFSENTSEDTCKGDSGGPLICNGVQVGLVMSGIGCGLGYNSYYVKVSAFYQYIMTHSSSGCVQYKQTISLIIIILYCSFTTIRFFPSLH